MATTKCGFDDSPGGKGCDLLIDYGPTLTVDIGLDPNFKPGQVLVFRDPAVRGVAALVDTGATESCIDSSLANQINLPVIDKRQVSGEGGSRETDVHLAQIYVPSIGITIHGEFIGVNLLAGGQQHQALIGRTFLRHFIMTYNGLTGDVELTQP